MLTEATRTGKALSQEGNALAFLTQVERETLLEGLQAEREALGAEILDGSMMEKVGLKFKDIAGVEMSEADAITINSKIEQAAATVEKVGATEAKALADAAKITVWTKVFIAINVVAIIGLAIWDHYKEKQIADELHETIAKVCTARLYAQVAERQELVHTDQMHNPNMGNVTAVGRSVLHKLADYDAKDKYGTTPLQAFNRRDTPSGLMLRAAFGELLENIERAKKMRVVATEDPAEGFGSAQSNDEFLDAHETLDN
ncbi:hypothetical protein B0T24DRAFT_592818 [Lasiosphaeria ovina]|uniref:Uncharacterized protein n=1 Tax=Lasiosphaeria ovina TaxID=92902 RepID=A0AAE0NBC7_9PEZI|nr:hypothetical protein B0T24DRAFT_592818 [Lasiosphaeria ovina]